VSQTVWLTQIIHHHTFLPVYLTSQITCVLFIIILSRKAKAVIGDSSPELKDSGVFSPNFYKLIFDFRLPES
jgi:hypothetical protein